MLIISILLGFLTALYSSSSMPFLHPPSAGNHKSAFCQYTLLSLLVQVALIPQTRQLEQHKCISPSSGSWRSEFMVPVYLGENSELQTSYLVEGANPSWVSLWGIYSIHKDCSPDLITSPKPYLPIISPWALSFQHRNFGGTQIFRP